MTDLKHEESKFCWCEPKLIYEDIKTGERVFVHKDLDTDIKKHQRREIKWHDQIQSERSA